MATNFSVTGLADYIQGNPIIAIQDLVLTGQTKDLFSYQTGIKATERVMDMSGSAAVLQTGDYTGITGHSGGVSLTDITITVTPLYVKEKYTKQILQGKLAQIAEKLGSNPEEIPFSDTIMELKGRQINFANEQLLWRGDTSTNGWGFNSSTGLNTLGVPVYTAVDPSVAANLAFFDGIIKQLYLDSSTVTIGSADASWGPLTGTSAPLVVNKIVDKFYTINPAFIGIETVMAMSPKDFMTYNRALYGLDGKNIITTLIIDKEPYQYMRVPGTNVIAHAVVGLTEIGSLTSSPIVLTRPENIIVGYDLKGEDEFLDFTYMDFPRWYELFAVYKLGVKVVRKYEVVAKLR